MKYQSLVSSTTPSDLQDWLGQELEDRGIDSVYARSILSLLQQDCVDVDPWECQHLKNQQFKVLHKYGVPESLYCSTKSKHQKWKTWSKKVLLTPHSCCKAVFCDLERIKKQAAVDCLRSASDYVNDIEELIDKVCIKLKNFNNLKNARDVHDQKIIDPFFIPPSSPTDDIKKYFDAFPPLNDNIDKTTEFYQHNIIKNAWCGECNMKTKPKSHISNRCYEQVIPYKPVKQTKNIYHNLENTDLLEYNDNETLSLVDTNNSKHTYNEASYDWQITNAQQIKLPKLIINYEKGSWNAMPFFMTKAIALPLEHLFLIKINTMFFNKIPTIHEEKTFNPHKYSNILALLKSDSSLKTLAECGFLICAFNAFSNVDHVKGCNNLICLRKICKNEFNSSMKKTSLIINKDYSNYLEIGTDNFSSLSGNKRRKIPFIEHSLSFTSIKASENSVFSKNKFDVLNFCPSLKAKVYDSNSFNEVYARSSNINKALSSKTFSYLSKMENVSSYPDSQSCGFFETESECKFKLLPYNVLKTTKEKFSIVNNMKQTFHSNNEDANLLSSKLSFWTSQGDYSLINYPSEENSLINEEQDLNLEIGTEKQVDLGECVVNCNRYVGQKLLKKVLFINKISLSNSHDKREEYSSASFEKLPFTISSNNIDLPNILMSSKEETLKKYQFRMDLDKCTEHVPKCKSSAKASVCSDFKSYDEMWLLYWGDNHNFIAHTWQKDNAVFEKYQHIQLLHESEVITALSKEIKEDGDELLKGLNSMPGISDDTVMTPIKEKPITVESDIYYNLDFVSQASNNFDYNGEEIFSHQVSKSQDMNDQNDTNVCTSFIDPSFTVNDINSDNPEMLQDFHNQLSCYNNSLEAPDYTDASAFPNSYENVDSIESDYCAEGEGWSFASEEFLDCTTFVNPYEKSCSLDNLDFENTESGYSEFLYQKRIRCTSETDEHVKQYLKKQNLTPFQKREIASRKRPCCFFLQGNCTRSDCKYSHDLSTTTCRFWKEGSCFKGTTCPFLHGYIKESDKDLCELDQLLKTHSADNYSLESEADFPSLSSAQTEPSKAKSAPIDITQVKGRKKVPKERKF